MLRWLLDKLAGRSKNTTELHLIESGEMSNQEGNDAIRAQIAAMGDDGTQVRHVIHYAYMTDAATETIDAVAAGLLGGFTSSLTVEKDGLVFEEYREVASMDFDAHTEQLKNDLAAIGWDYDGWECAVVTEGEST